MAMTRPYKAGAERTKYITTETGFASGMKYTNAPHMSGFAKTMVNFNIKNGGEALAPRGGLCLVMDKVSEQVVAETNKDYCVHHSGAMYVDYFDSSNAELCSYSLIGATDANGLFICAGANLVVEYGSYLNAVYVGDTASRKLLMKPAAYEAHGMLIAEPHPRVGISASLEANTYVLVQDATESYLGSIKAKFNEARTEITWEVSKVTSTEVQPAQAINYGYNMWKTNPYTFANTSLGATGNPVLTGIVPYSEQGELLLTARPGTPIVFKVFYKYPESDITDKYLFQFEIQNLDTSVDAVVIHKVRDSLEYTPGDEVSFTYSPTFTSFSVIVKCYKKTAIISQDASWDASTTLQALMTKDAHLSPTQVITLASYYLTSNNASSMLNATPAKFNLGTARGMCYWQQRIVLWGVQGAKGTLFVSEINDPGYMPYPNNSEIFSDDIIVCVPYMTNLLVFTKSSLYKLVLNPDGLSYTTTCVQERLNMRESDIASVFTVQNMVYFKSGNYYYMVVPNTASITGEMQIAPVTRSVEQIFDNFEDSCKDILNSVYNLHYTESDDDYNIELMDTHSYLDDTQVRNTYKFKTTLVTGARKTVEYYFDLSFNYDTVLRAWTTYAWEASPYRMVVYKPTVTSKSIFAHLWYHDYRVYTSYIQFNDAFVLDAIPLNNAARHGFGNFQYLDTGYRDYDIEMKKRFREVQFSVNMLQQGQLNFHTAFVTDDVEVVPMYEHVVSQITDKTDPNYGVVFVERILADSLETPSLTQLGAWQLDGSVFPDINVFKIRYRMSAKGYGGAVRILSTNEVPYELLHMSWIYRTLFSR